MKPVERYRAALDDTKAPDTLKEKLLAIPAQYAAEASATTDTAASETTANPEGAAPSSSTPNPLSADKEIHFAKGIRFALPKHWKKQALAAAACFASGVFAAGSFGALLDNSLNGITMMAGDSMMESATATSGSTGGYSTTTAMDASNALDMGTGEVVVSVSADDVATTRSVAESTTRKIIYTTDLTLESKAFDDTLAALSAAVSEAGGYLEYSENYNNASSGARSASLTYRIPATEYATFLSGVGEAGNITYQSESANDVTSTYLDLEARITTLTQQRDRLWELQAQAENLTDLLEIESVLTDVLYEIESYQSQLNYLADQVDYATVSIYLKEVIEYTVQEPTAWETIAATFTKGLTNFISTISNIFLTVLSLWTWITLALLCIFVYHKIKRKKAKKQ